MAGEDVSITVGVDGLSDASQQLVDSGAAVDRLNQSFKSASDAINGYADGLQKGSANLKEYRDLAAAAYAQQAQLGAQWAKDTDVENGNKAAIAAMSDSIAQLTARLDPAYAAATRYTDGLKLLDAGLKAGSIDAQEHARLQGLLSSQFDASTQATTTLASGHSALAGNVAFTTREVRALFDELASGRSRQAIGTATLLTTRLTGIGLAGLGAIAGVVGLVGTLAYFAIQAEEHARAAGQIQAAFASTGAAGLMSRDQVQAFINTLRILPDVTREVATETVTEFARIPNLTIPEIQAVSNVLDDFAYVSGKKLPDAARLLSNAFLDPIKTAAELDKQFNLFTAGQLDLIKSFVEMGDKMSAGNIIIDAVTARFKGLHEQAMTPLQVTALSLKEIWIDLTGTIGKTDNIDRARAALQSLIALAPEAALASQGINLRGGTTGETNLAGGVPGSAPISVSGNAAAALSQTSNLLQQQTKDFLSANQGMVGYIETWKGVQAQLVTADILLAKQQEIMAQNPVGSQKWQDAAVAVNKLTDASANLDKKLFEMGDTSARNKALAEAYFSVQNQGLQIAQTQLDQAHSRGLVSDQDFYAARAAYQKVAIDLEIKKEGELRDIIQAAPTTDPKAAAARDAQVAAINARITALGLQRGQVDTTADFDLQQQLDKESKAVMQASVKAFTDQGEFVNAAVTSFALKYGEQMKKMSEAGNQAQLDAMNNKLNVEVGKASLKELDRAFMDTTKLWSDAQSEINVQVKTGQITAYDGQIKLVDAAKMYADQEADIIAKQQAIIDNLKVQGQASDQEEQNLAKHIQQWNQLKIIIASTPTSFTGGMDKAMNEYIGKMGNVAQQGHDFMVKTLDDVQNSIYNFLKTGKFDWSSLTAALKDEMLQRTSQMITATLAQLFKPSIDAVGKMFTDTLNSLDWTTIFSPLKTFFMGILKWLSDSFGGIFSTLFGSIGGGSGGGAGGSIGGAAVSGGTNLLTGGFSKTPIGQIWDKITGGSSTAGTSAGGTTTIDFGGGVATGGEAGSAGGATTIDFGGGVATGGTGTGTATGSTVAAGGETGGTVSAVGAAAVGNALVAVPGAIIIAGAIMSMFDKGPAPIAPTPEELAAEAYYRPGGAGYTQTAAMFTGQMPLTDYVKTLFSVPDEALSPDGRLVMNVKDDSGAAFVSLYDMALGLAYEHLHDIGYVHPADAPGNQQHRAFKYASGADTIATSPTLFMAGEVGPERIQVSPLGGAARFGAGAGGGVVFAGPNIIDSYSWKKFVNKMGKALA